MTIQNKLVENPAISVCINGDGEFVYVHLGTAEVVLDYRSTDRQIHAAVYGGQHQSKTEIAHSLLNAHGPDVASRFGMMVDAGLYIPPTPGLAIQYPPDIYYSMMLNTDRVYPYLVALSKCVEKDSLVVELGAGLGIFALYAAKLGAEVIVLEPGRVIDVCKKIAKRNMLDSRIQFIQDVVRNLKLEDRKADVVVSEFIGESFFDEKILQHSAYAKKHILKPGGQLIPSGLHVYMQGVQSDEARGRTRMQSEEIVKVGNSMGFDLADLQNLVPWYHQNRLVHHSRNCEDLTWYQDAMAITSGELLTGVDFNGEFEGNTVLKEGVVNLTVTDDGFIDALYFYFSAQIDAEITLSNSLADRDLFSWPHRFTPVNNSRRFYRAGDNVRVAWKFIEWFSRSEFRFIARIID